MPDELVLRVDLVQQVGVVDAEHLVLQERRVRLAVLFLVLRGRPLVLINAVLIAILLFLSRLSKELHLGAELHGGVLVEAPLADEPVALGPEI